MQKIDIDDKDAAIFGLLGICVVACIFLADRLALEICQMAIPAIAGLAIGRKQWASKD